MHNICLLFRTDYIVSYVLNAIIQTSSGNTNHTPPPRGRVHMHLAVNPFVPQISNHSIFLYTSSIYLDIGVHSLGMGLSVLGL